MANCYRAAVRVDAVPGKSPEVPHYPSLAFNPVSVFERSDVSQYLGGKGLVDLPKINIIVAKIAAIKEPWNGVGRSHQEAFVLQIDRRDLASDQARKWCVVRQPSKASFGRTQTAAAPSVKGDELPAVKLPRPLTRSKAAGRCASFSSDVSARGIVS